MVADSHSALEYSTFKVPYENLNKRFRESQKALERQNARIKDSGRDVSSKLGRKEAVPVQEVSASIATFRDRLCQLDGLFKKSVAEEIKMVESMQNRAAYLRTMEDENLDELSKWTWKRQRVDRMVVGHMIRCGYIESAKELAEKSGIMHMCDLELFKRAKKVEEGLKTHNTAPCLEWIQMHKSKLRRIGSSLEVAVRIQDGLELYRNGKRKDVLAYSRRYIAPLDMEKHHLCRKFMTLLGMGRSSPYHKQLLSEENWKGLLITFREDNAKIFQLPEESTLSACVQCGICVFKTPACEPGSNERCIACHPSVYALAEGLPFSHASNSRLICAYSGEPLNEDNVPMMLPTGRVYGEKAIKELTQGESVRCPKTDQMMPLTNVQRLYIL